MCQTCALMSWRAATRLQGIGIETFGPCVGGLVVALLGRLDAVDDGALWVWGPTLDAQGEIGWDLPLPRFWDELSAWLSDRGSPLVLATGHIGRAEIHEAVDAAFAAGVSQVVVTHPDYPSQGVPLEEQRELAARGALLERCFAPIHSGKVSWEATFAAIRATGVEHNVLSTDLGQPANPPVEDGLALMADRLLEAGFAEEDVHTMAVVNTRRLAGAD